MKNIANFCKTLQIAKQIMCFTNYLFCLSFAKQSRHLLCIRICFANDDRAEALRAPRNENPTLPFPFLNSCLYPSGGNTRFAHLTLLSA